jgi:heterokaryon incompatibility protein (HET)
MALCEQCGEIDFRAAGVHAPGDPSYNFFALDDISYLPLKERAEDCVFCKAVSEAFLRWAEAYFGTIDRLHLSDVRVDFAALRYKSRAEIDDDDKADGSVISSPSLFRISASFTIQDPDGDRLLGPSFEFQKVGTPNITVESMFDGSNPETEFLEPCTGRIRPLLADCRLFEKWKNDCLAAHQGQCGAWFPGKKPPNLRLIDVKRKCIIEGTLGFRWVALSYIWGEAQILTLKHHVYEDFLSPGYLSCDRVPKTIYDAMKLTDSIGETFLWVDSLCIIQDDLNDKLNYIPCMDAIYGHSILTIIAACGKDAQSGLSGMRQGSRLCIQEPFTAKGIAFVQTLDPVNVNSTGYLAESRWNTRGWTFQEGLLSPRLLIFTPEQVYWQCGESSWCEDGFWEVENSQAVYRHGLVDSFRNIWCSRTESAEKRYRQLVEVYSQRTLTQESDGLDAFKGILSAFELHSGMEFFWALPVKYFGTALTWPAHDDEVQVRRRTGLCKLSDPSGRVVDCPFPTWSWVGWVGKIYFDEVFGLLTSRHANLIFYRLTRECEVEVVPQISDFKEKYEGSSLLSGEPKPPRPIWREDLRTEIMKSDIPSEVFQTGVSNTILAFWSSAVAVTLQYVHSGRKWDLGARVAEPKVLQNGVEVKAMWGQIPRHPPGLEAEDVRLIVIGRNTLSLLRGKEQLVAIVADRDTNKGLTYRRALVTVDEEEWNSLQRTWEKIILA